VGDIFGDGARCAADRSKYNGKCKDRAIKFVRLTKRAKRRWGDLCGFQWPCRHCERRYSEPCPLGWVTDLSKGPKTTFCTAPPDYTGPCDSTDFLWFNDKAKEEWSSECEAYWPCEQR
jgi:CPW-WPC domain-containing protein